MKLINSILFYLFTGYLNFFLAINIINPTLGTPILPDIGFYLLPHISYIYTDIIISVIFLYFYIKWYYLDKQLLARFFYLSGFMLFIRLFTFSVTLIPPCINDCVSRKHGESFIWITHQIDLGCSDHMFSGHAVHFTLFMLMTLYSSNKYWEKIFMGIIYLPYLLLIIASKLHYTVDVLIGSILTTLIYYIDSEGLFLDKIEKKYNNIWNHIDYFLLLNM